MPGALLGASDPEMGKAEWALSCGADGFGVPCLGDHGQGNDSFRLLSQRKISPSRGNRLTHTITELLASGCAHLLHFFSFISAISRPFTFLPYAPASRHV